MRPVVALVVLVVVGWLGVRRWRAAWVLEAAPDARVPGLVETEAGLTLSADADPWRLTDRHHLLARVLVHEDASLPLETRVVLASASLSPDLSGLLGITLGLTPEQAALALSPVLQRQVAAACPAVPGRLARRCDERGWADLRQRLPSVLAAALVDADDRLTVEILEWACQDRELAGRVAGAVRATGPARAGVARPRALALFLDGCADPAGDAALRALSLPPPVQWMAALELAGRPDVPDAGDAPTLTAALLRYSASISSSRTAEPSSP